MRRDIRYSQVIDSDEARAAQASADRAPRMASDDIDIETFFITQHFERYTADDHRVWGEMYARLADWLDESASAVYMNGLRLLELDRAQVPRCTDVNAKLGPLTGWQSRPVPGYLPAKAFFACLAKRTFPTTITVRPRELMDYLPEPDIFHDVFGHVPLHADPVFAEFLQTYGEAALRCEDPVHIERLGRLFWFTVEFGLIEEGGRTKLYGSGLISSIGESRHAIESPYVDRRPFDLDRVCETHFEIDHYQPILYVLDSFEQLRDAMNLYADRVLSDAPTAVS
ncbi:MAG: phenylalanine 4-monooxygenase [Phycisphaerales bacterium]|nr:phenylalanine 4-monooxygenase [Phycisphaerales bacterium]